MKGDARYLWKHEIPKISEFQLNGKEIIREENFRRVSVTFRSMVEGDPRVIKKPVPT